ncbi:MAG: hypothetical protein LBK53_09095 [Heliobacteriaceae bacterium]|jgi:phage tail tape-measure protein|nr:hypothetical protein [Heliobacteriaceae bacterium]
MSIGAIAAKVVHYAGRALKAYPSVVFGTSAESGTKLLKGTFYGVKDPVTKQVVQKGQYFKGIWKQLKDCFKLIEKESAKECAGGFWKTMKGNLRKLLPDIGQSIKTGYNGGSGFFNKLWGGTKGLGSGIAKKMPLIGSLLILAFELPNIFKATVNEGIVSGAAETVKAGARVGGGMVGAALGSALIPIPLVGGLVGWLAGEWIAGKLVGKSYSQRKAAEKAKTAQPQATQQQQAYNQIPDYNIPGYSQADLMRMQQMLYGNRMTNSMDADFMAANSGLNRWG